jgi:hypothetical protein
VDNTRTVRQRLLALEDDLGMLGGATEANKRVVGQQSGANTDSRPDRFRGGATKIRASRTDPISLAVPRNSQESSLKFRSVFTPVFPGRSQY